MAVNKRNIREVVDACFDMDGAENVNSSLRTGWTDHLMNYYAPYVGSLSQLYNQFHFLWEDSNNQFPTQSQYEPIVNSGVTESIIGSAQSDTGLKHLNHQMQAMKGLGSSNGYPVAGGGNSTQLDGVTMGTGTYINNDISMGNMRDFEYHINMNGVWGSTNGGTAEKLISSGEISVGSTS
ncbi:hypothetical protein N9Z72_02365 [Akkermansiaceae bacterium]|nr:hypothetical protein [Akkermansiaceae bacterium]|tara:strand:- start:286 stop:825 length:540 start_codon:yes stop_codon:yes gene_type:complete